MPVPSTITDLSDTANSNFPQDTDSTGSTVASLPRAIQAILKKQFIRGSDITIAAPGVATIPTEGSYFVVNGSGSTVAGFGANYNGRITTLEFTGALTLVHSASFILPDGVNITTASGDTVMLVNETGTTWRVINYVKASIANALIPYATLASPVFTGNPTAPTPSLGDNDTSIATTAFVQSTFAAGGAITGQLQSTRANNTADGGGQLFLNGASGNRIDFNTNGLSAPTFTTRSAGSKIVLYPQLSASLTDYAIGMESGALWFGAGSTSGDFKFYGGTSLAATLSGFGDFSAKGKIISSSPTAGIGYATGAGGTVTQATSKSTSVTLNKVCGTITMHAASLASNAVATFTLNNSVLASTDNMVLNAVSGTDGAYLVTLAGVANGSCTISIRNLTGGALAEAVQIRFTIFNSTNA